MSSPSSIVGTRSPSLGHDTPASACLGTAAESTLEPPHTFESGLDDARRFVDRVLRHQFAGGLARRDAASATGGDFTNRAGRSSAARLMGGGSQTLKSACSRFAWHLAVCMA